MTVTKVLYHRNPQFTKCPSCKAMGTLHRSRSKNMFEQILRRTTFLKTYRCKECGWRGFKSTIILTKRSIRSIILYTLLILLTGYLAKYLITNYGLN